MSSFVFDLTLRIINTNKLKNRKKKQILEIKATGARYSADFTSRSSEFALKSDIMVTVSETINSKKINYFLANDSERNDRFDTD